MIKFDFFEQKSPKQRFLFILGLFMLAVYVGIAYLIIFSHNTLGVKMDPEYRIAFGVILFVYSIIRFGRLIKQKDDEI